MIIPGIEFLMLNWIIPSIRESVDSLCKDGTDAICAILKQKPYNFTTNTLKAYPGFLFECLCDQQDSYKWPKLSHAEDS